MAKIDELIAKARETKERRVEILQNFILKNDENADISTLSTVEDCTNYINNELGGMSGLLKMDRFEDDITIPNNENNENNGNDENNENSEDNENDDSSIGMGNMEDDVSIDDKGDE